MWVLLWGKGISELKEFPFISKFRVGIKAQLMKTSKAHLHGKHYCPTIISETQYVDILTRNQGWKEWVPLILRGLVIWGVDDSEASTIMSRFSLAWLHIWWAQHHPQGAKWGLEVDHTASDLKVTPSVVSTVSYTRMISVCSLSLRSLVCVSRSTCFSTLISDLLCDEDNAHRQPLELQ
jgi:hypothetical protein